MQARRSASLIAALFVMSLVRASAAQSSSIAIDQLDPAPAGDVLVGVPSPYARGSFVPRFTAMLDYARDPLRLTQTTGTTHLVQSQAFVHLNASFAIDDRLLVSALLPIAVDQNEQKEHVEGQTISPQRGAGIGDLRLGLRVRMAGDDDGPIQLGVGAYLRLPTGKSGGFVGEGSVREVPHVSAGGRLDTAIPLLWATSVGVLIRDSANPSAFQAGGGVVASILSDRLRFGPEVYVSIPLEDGTYTLSDTVKVPSHNATNAELLVSLRGRLIGGFIFGVAGGPGLTDAPGTPALRLTTTIGWVPEPDARPSGPRDTDGDGILDADDACPYAFGPRRADPRKNGCPILDDDEDGIPNDEDACPQQYGPRNADPKKNGCPAAPLPER